MPNRFGLHRNLAVLVLLALIPLRGIFAQTQPQTAASTAEEQLTKAVGFVTVPYKDGSTIRSVRGTCFLVYVPDERLGKGQGFVYIVTNRHVATVRNGSFRMFGGFPYQLVGVVNGFIPERDDIQVSGAATFESSSEPNSGILTFVPAQELKDLLDSPELQKLRDDVVASQHKP